MSLPPGIWDNPTPEEQLSYEQFVHAWNLSDAAYQEHYNEWASDQDVLTTFDYGYGNPCGHCTDGPGKPAENDADVQLAFLPVVPADETPILRGLTDRMPSHEGGESIWEQYLYASCSHLQFGYQFPQPLVEDGIVKAQSENYQISTGWAKFTNKTYSDDTSDPEYYIPIGSVATYAFVRMWPDTRFTQITYSIPLCYSSPSGDYRFPDGTGFCEGGRADSTKDMKTNLLGAGKQEINIGKSTWMNWTKGIPYDSNELTCFIAQAWGTDSIEPTNPGNGVLIEQATADYPVFMFIGPPASYYTIGGTCHYVTEKVELGVYFYPPTIGVLAGGTAEVNQDGIFDEVMNGGVVVNGTSPDEFVHSTSGGVVAGGSVPQYIKYEATGGVIVQRPDVELHLDFNIEDDSTAQDVSSHERHSGLVNMDSTSFTDGRITNNKYMDFEG